MATRTEWIMELANMLNEPYTYDKEWGFPDSGNDSDDMESEED